MNVYLGKDRKRAAQHLTTTHNTVAILTRGVEGFVHKLYVDNFYSSPDLYDDLVQKKIFCCGIVRLHRKGMPKDLKPKTLRLNRGDIRVRTRGDMTAVVWKDKRDVCLLTNIHDPPREGNYRDEHGQPANTEVNKKALFPPVRPGHCQQLHPFIFMWWEENFTQRFSSHPYQRDAGMVWA